MKFIYIYLSLFLILFVGLPTKAQQELGTHFMTDIWQSTHTNPAFVTKKKWTVALPSLYYDFTHNGGTINDIYTTKNGQNSIDFGNFIDLLDPQNELNAHLNIPILGLAYQVNDNLNINIGYQTRFQTSINYPKELAGVLWYGNANYIGETIEIGPQLDLLSYNELAIGATYQHNKWTIGGKLKYLSGNGTITTDEHYASLFTSDDVYQLTLETDYSIRTSDFIEINGFDDVNLSFDRNLGSVFSKHSGFGLDLGLRYQVNDKLELNASVMDFGSINWDNARSYHSQGQTEYDGVDVTNYLLSDTVEFELKLDTLEEIFAFEESQISLSTRLTERYFLGANYKINEKLTVGGVYLLQRSPLSTTSAFSLSARMQILKMLTLGVNYSSRNEQFDNLGLNLLVQLGPVQLYAMTDQVLGAFVPNNSTNLNLRTGLNLQF